MVIKVRCLILAFILLSIQIGCGDRSEISIPSPQIYTIEPDSALYGDTVVVTGKGFLGGGDYISLKFLPISQSGKFPSGKDAIVSPECYLKGELVSLSSNRLVALVPEGAFGGSVVVEKKVMLSSSPFGVELPGATSNRLLFKVSLFRGDIARVFFASTYYEFALSGEDDGRRYLMIVFNSSVPSSADELYDYSLSLSGGKSSKDRGVVSVSGSGRSISGSSMPMHVASMVKENTIKKKVQEELFPLLRGNRGYVREAGEYDELMQPAEQVEGEIPATARFVVLSDIDGSILDPASFTEVEAELKYTGDHTLLYVDVTTPQSYFTQADAEFLGGIFDEHIYSNDNQYFGHESDINGDGRVAILLSPVINRLTPPGTAGTEGFIAGFFLANDLLPSALNESISNGMEIFYCMVPDPDGVYGNVYQKEETIDILRGVLAHEFLHMILFNYRILIYGRGYSADYMEELWLNEGLAHIAEDLNGYNSSNIKRANLFLNDPPSVTLIYGGDELEERGAEYLFLRYLGDRFGNDIFRNLVQSKESGVKNIEMRTGESFKNIFTDWAATCYLTGRGITSDPRYRYSSIDLQGDFAPLHVEQVGDGVTAFTGELKAMACEFILLNLAENFPCGVSLQSGNGRLNFALIRLD